MEWTRTVRWHRDRKAPKIKLDSIDCDVLVVHVVGDCQRTFRLPRDFLARIARHHPGPPEHYTIKIVPNFGNFRQYEQWPMDPITREVLDEIEYIAKHGYEPLPKKE